MAITKSPRPTMGRFVLLVMTTMILSGCNLQHKLLYFPSSQTPDEKLLRAADLTLWPSPSSADYRGLVSTRDLPSAKGTIIVFHGNGGTAIDRIFYLQTISAMGYRVILAEYPQYGGRKGQLGEKAFVADALETIRLASKDFGAPLFLVGESLGCGVAAAAAAQSAITIRGLLLITPWDTLAAIAQTKFPLLPVQFFLTDSYDNVANLKSFPGRVAVVGAGRDAIIPIRHAENLYHSLASLSKRMWRIPMAGHNDLLFQTDQRWWREVINFVSNSESD